MTMLERIARASFACWCKRRGKTDLVLEDLDNGEDEMEFAYIHARAILEAMRNPTKQMVEAGQDAVVCIFDQMQAAPPEDDNMRYTWNAMIDAALNEKP